MKIIDLTKGIRPEKQPLTNLIIENYLSKQNVTLNLLSIKLSETGLFNDYFLEDVHKTLSNIYKKTKEIFDNFNINMWPYAGTQLGLIRENSIITHDDDMDFTVNFNELISNKDKIIEMLNQNNLEFSNEKILNGNWSNLSSMLATGIQEKEETYFKVGEHYFAKKLSIDLFPMVSYDEPKKYWNLVNYQYFGHLYDLPNPENINYKNHFLKNIDHFNWAIEFDSDFLKIKKKLLKKISNFKLANPNKYSKKSSKNMQKFNKLFNELSTSDSKKFRPLSKDSMRTLPREFGSIEKCEQFDFEYIFSENFSDESALFYGGTWKTNPGVGPLKILSRDNYKGKNLFNSNENNN